MRFVFINHAAAETAISTCHTQQQKIAAIGQALLDKGVHTYEDWFGPRYDTFMLSLNDVLRELSLGIDDLADAATNMHNGLERASADERRAEEEARREEERRRRQRQSGQPS